MKDTSQKDVYDIKPIITTEYNIEGYPTEDFIKMVLEIRPDQVTLVPDGPNVITSCAYRMGYNKISGLFKRDYIYF